MRTASRKFVRSLLKTDDKNIHRLCSLVTGISYIAGIRWSGVANNIVTSKFTEYHPFNQFYGFQLKEIESLLDKLGKLPGSDFKKNTLDIIKAEYNGYEYPGSVDKSGGNIYCPWSVLNYLRRGSPELFWVGAQNTQPLTSMFRNVDTKMFLLKLLQEDGEEMLLIVGNLTADDLVKLMQYMKGTLTEGTHHLFLNLILELGYLTVESKTQNNHHVKIPNLEIKVLILQKLTDHYVHICSQEFKNNAYIKSEEILNWIKSAADPNVSDEEFEIALRKFRLELQILFQQYSTCLPIVNESGIHCFLSYIISAGGFDYLTEHWIQDTDSSKSRLDVLGFLVELTSKKSAVDALNQILNKEYIDAFEHPMLSNINGYECRQG